MPSIISFLMISPAGLPMRSDKSRTVIVSAVINAFSIFTGSGRGAEACCFFLRLPRTISSSSPPFIFTPLLRRVRAARSGSFWRTYCFLLGS